MVECGVLSVGRFFNVTVEDYILKFFSWVWVETHLPLSDPVINLLKVFINIIRQSIEITVTPLYSERHRDLKIVSVIGRCPLHRGFS